MLRPTFPYSPSHVRYRAARDLLRFRRPRRGLLSALVLVAVAVALTAAALERPRTAFADDNMPPFLRIERVTVEPSVFRGMWKLQLAVTAVDLYGTAVTNIADERAFRLRLGRERVRAPYLAGRFRGTEHPLAIALVLQTSASFADVLPAIRSEIGQYLRQLPSTAQVLLLYYDSDIHGSSRAVTPRRILRDLGDIEASGIDGEHQLTAAVERARRALTRLRRAQPVSPPRTFIVVIGDGRNADMSPDAYRQVAKRALRDDVRIHTIGYAPDRNRLPLRGLAEMSKRTGGTFRFVQNKASFAKHVAELGRETNDQYILSYFLPAAALVGDAVGKRLTLRVEGRDLSAPPVRLPAPSCGGVTCEPKAYCAAGQCVARYSGSLTGVWTVILWGLAGLAALVVVIVLLILIVAGIRRLAGNRSPRQPTADPATAGQQAPAQQPVPSHRIMPQGPAVAPQAQQAHAGRLPSQHQHPSDPRRQHSHPGHPASGQVSALVTPPPRRAPSVAATPAPRAPAVLLMTNGPHAGARIALEHGLVAGTAHGCHLHLVGDRHASSHHAQFTCDAGGNWTVVDRGSTNGTYVNGVRITQKALAHGMLIQMGATEVRFLNQ